MHMPIKVEPHKLALVYFLSLPGTSDAFLRGEYVGQRRRPAQVQLRVDVAQELGLLLQIDRGHGVVEEPRPLRRRVPSGDLHEVGQDVRLEHAQEKLVGGQPVHLHAVQNLHCRRGD